LLYDQKRAVSRINNGDDLALDFLATDAVRETEDWIRSRLKKKKGG
jgi:hypothetical protein